MQHKAAMLLAVLIMIASGYAVVTAWDWPWKAALFPLVIGIPVFLFATAEIVWGLLGKHAVHEGAAKDFQVSTTHLPEKESLRRIAIAIAWLLGFFGAIVLLGFPLAIPVFVFVFLVVQGRERWIFSAVFAAVIWTLFYGLFDRLLHLPFPAGLLQAWLGLA